MTHAQASRSPLLVTTELKYLQALQAVHGAAHTFVDSPGDLRGAVALGKLREALEALRHLPDHPTIRIDTTITPPPNPIVERARKKTPAPEPTPDGMGITWSLISRLTERVTALEDGFDLSLPNHLPDRLRALEATSEHFRRRLEALESDQ